MARRFGARASMAGLLAAALLGGCGGDKGRASTSVVLKLGTQGAIAGQTIRGVELVVAIPAGVTLAVDAAGAPSEGALAASGGAAGGGALVSGHYTPATASAPAALKLVLVKTAGFEPGEFATLRLALASATAPPVAAFVLSGFKAVDEKGAAIPGLEPTSAIAAR